MIGTYNLRLLTVNLTSGKFTDDTKLNEVYIKECFKVLSDNDFIFRLAKAFSRHQYVVVTSGVAIKKTFHVTEAKHLLEFHKK